MFTGIIEEVGTVDRIAIGAESAVLTISADKVLEGTKLGDSIAVNGVCLTVTSLQGDRFQADVMAETLRRSSLGALGRGSRVNLERAMAAGGRFGGHIVAGHIDGTEPFFPQGRRAMPSGLRSEQVRRSCVILSRRDPLQSMGSA